MKTYYLSLIFCLLYYISSLGQTIVNVKSQSADIQVVVCRFEKGAGEAMGDRSVSFNNKSVSYILKHLLDNYDLIFLKKQDILLKDNLNLRITTKQPDSLRNFKFNTALMIMKFYKLNYKVTKSKKIKWVLDYDEKHKQLAIIRGKNEEGLLEVTQNKTYKAYCVNGMFLSRSLSKMFGLEILNNIPDKIKISLKIDDINVDFKVIAKELENKYGILLKQKEVNSNIIEIL